MTELIVEPLSRRPELGPMLWQLEGVWPMYLTKDSVSDFYYDAVERDFAEFALVAYEPGRPDVTVARALAVPFAFGPDAGRPELPDGGWDAAITWGVLDRAEGRRPTHVSALEIAIRPEHQGKGLAARLLAAMTGNARRLGFADLFAPVRPNAKPNEPHTPMSEYAYRTRADGLPADPWLRVHVRAGGQIVGVCPRAMTVAGSLREWRTWTGLPFDRTGDVVIPGGLVPAHCSVEHDHAVYVEPGVWVHHRL